MMCATFKKTVSHLIVVAVSLLVSAGPSFSQSDTESIARAIETLRKSNSLPFPVPMMVNPTDTYWEPNTVSQPFPRESRQAMMTSGAMSNPWSLRQVFNFMTHKVKAKEGLSFEEIIEAMDSRAIDENLKKSGHSMIWKEVEAKTGRPTPRIEILQYCDAMVARMVLDYSPEFSIFLPCRISVLEDAKGDVWLMTLDWDVSWLNFAWHPDSQLDEELKKGGKRIRDAMLSIVDAGANGDW